MCSQWKWARGATQSTSAVLVGLLGTLGCSSDSGGKPAANDDMNCAGAACMGGASGSGGSAGSNGSPTDVLGCPGADGKLLPTGDILYEIPGDISDLDRAGDQLYYVGIPSLIGGPGMGGVFRAPAAGGGTFEEVISSDDYQVVKLTVLKDNLFAETAFDGVYQFTLDGTLVGDRSAAGDHARTDGEAVYTWFDDSSLCGDSQDFGLNRLDADGTITSIDAQAHCVKDVAVGGDSVYWLQGDDYGDVDTGKTKISLFRAPKTGGGPTETLPLAVANWHYLEWTNGYVIGRTVGDYLRARPEDATPTFVGHGVSELTDDGAGTEFFTDGSDKYGCLVHAAGNGDVVPFGSFDPNKSLVNLIAAYPDYVYFTLDADDESGLDRTTVVHRLAR